MSDFIILVRFEAHKLQKLHLLAFFGLIAYLATFKPHFAAAQPKWQLKFENSTYTGDGDPPEIWVKAFDPSKEAGNITGKKMLKLISKVK